MSDITSAFDAPEDARNSFREGLGFISGLEEEAHRSLLKWARVPRPGGGFGDRTSLHLETGILPEQAGPIWLAVTMMVSSLRESSVTGEKFIRAGFELGELTEEMIPGLTRFANLIVSHRSELKEASDSAQLQNIVVPTLTHFELALDARVEISGESVTRGVPVALAYIDTDSEGQVVWFQMDEARVVELRDKLSRTLDEIKILKQWMNDAKRS